MARPPRDTATPCMGTRVASFSLTGCMVSPCCGNLARHLTWGGLDRGRKCSFTIGSCLEMPAARAVGTGRENAPPSPCQPRRPPVLFAAFRRENAMTYGIWPQYSGSLSAKACEHLSRAAHVSFHQSLGLHKGQPATDQGPLPISQPRVSVSEIRADGCTVQPRLSAPKI